MLNWRPMIQVLRRKATRQLVLVWMGMLFGLSTTAQTTWRRTYGGLDSDEARDVRYMSDGGFLICGSTGSFGDGGDIYVVRTDDSGIVLWSGYYGGVGAQYAVSCIEVPDGALVAGTASNGPLGGYDMLLLKLGAGGEELWRRYYGGSEWDVCHDMAKMPDGTVLAGVTYGSGAFSGDAFVVRTDLVGDTLWTRRFGGPGLDEALGVDVDDDGNVLVSGRMDGNTEEQDAFVARLSPDGELEWLSRFGGDSLDFASGVAASPGGGYAVVGGTRSYTDVLQVLVRGISATGDSLWQQMHGSLADTWAYRIVPRPTDGYALIGHNGVFNAGGRDMFMILVNGEGHWHLGKNYGGEGNEEGYGIEALSDGGFILVGMTDHYGPGVSAAYVVRCGADAETEDDTVYPFFDPVGITETPGPLVRSSMLYPNPNAGEFFITVGVDVDRVVLLDMSGRAVEEHRLRSGVSSVRTALPTGVYLAEMWANDRRIGVGRVQVLRP